MDEKIRKAAEFATTFTVPFANVMVKLMDAKNQDNGVELDSGEVKLLIQAMQLLSEGTQEGES